MKKIDLLSLTQVLQQPESYRRLIKIDYSLKEYAELNSTFSGNSAMLIKKYSLMTNGDYMGIKRPEDVSRHFEGLNNILARKESLIAEMREQILAMELEVHSHKQITSQFESDSKEK